MKKMFTLLLVMSLTIGLSLANTTTKSGLSGNIEKSIEKISHQLNMPDLSWPIMRVVSKTIAQKNTSLQILGTPYADEMINLDWNGSGWDYSERTLSLFDNNGLLTDMYEYEWDPSGWLNSSHTIFTNNAAGNPTLAIIKTWDEDNKIWEDMGRITLTYNSNNLVTNTLISLYYGGNWIDFMRMSASYNAQKKVTEELTEVFEMQTMVWENNSKTLYTYNNGGYLYQETEQTWDFVAWQNSERTTSTYNSSNFVTEDVIEYMESNGWEIDSRLLYSYDSHWNVTETKEQHFEQNIWENLMLYTGTYNAQNKLLEWVTQYWDGTTYGNEEKDVYLYGLTIIGINPISETEIPFSLYPNPATSHTSISFNLPVSSLVDITIHDFSGRTVQTQNLGILGSGEHTTTFSTTSLSQGYYFVTLSNGNEILSKEKLVIVK